MDSYVRSSIDGLIISPLSVFSDERGAVLHMMRSDSDLFKGFGEVYFSQVNPGVIKGWKLHKKMTQNFTVPVGRIKVVVYDAREQSKSFGEIVEVTLGRPDQYHLLQVPPGVWYAFQNIGEQDALLTNCADMPHDPGEAQTQSLDQLDIAYAW
jgi:dTDP-4-dehydrorhamnose 3,5-epimerase